MRLRYIVFIFFIIRASSLFAQSPYHFNVTTSIEQCAKGTAQLVVSGYQSSDSVSILWSNGVADILTQADLPGGDYTVNVKIMHRKDTVVHTIDSSFVVILKDTSVYFNIGKEECVVLIPKYFSPNGDNYADVLGITNIGYYPDFELAIFNKWGQRVHHQRSKYVPWDGTWLNVDLPDGAYYYVFFYDAANHSRLIKGDITILR